MIDTMKFTHFMKLEISEDEKIWATALHLSPLLNLAFPLLGILTPIGIWYHHRESSPYIRTQARELANLILLGIVLGLIALFLIAPMLYFLPGSRYLLAFAGVLSLPGLLLPLWGAFNTFQGHDFRYPLPFRLFQHQK